jgi:HK97 family phage major capsid protein
MPEDIKDKLSDLSEVVEKLNQIQAKQAQDAIDRDVLAQLTSKVGELSEQITKGQSAGRISEFEVKDAEDLVKYRDVLPKGKKAIDAILEMPSEAAEVKRVQEVMDTCHILSAATGKPYHQLTYFKRNYHNLPLLQKSLNVADIANWQPTVFSSRIIEKVRLQLVLANLHTRINMPFNPYKFPIEGNDAFAYLVDEQGDVDADLTASNRVPSALTQTGATNLTLQAVKLGGRVTLSNEQDEDAFLPVMDLIEENIVACMARAQDNVVMNGDSAGTFDTAGYHTRDQRKAWDGYRKMVNSLTSKVANGNTSTIDIAKIREVRQKMGKFGINPSDLVMITGPVGYVKLLGLKDGSNPSPVLTLEKYGQDATIKRGELARVDGIPIIISEYVGPVTDTISGAENLNVSGVYDGTTTDYTEIVFVQPSRFRFGDLRQATLKAKEEILTDQQIMVILQRLTFKNFYSGQNVLGAITGILK